MPQARSTQDLDLFLTVDLLVDAERIIKLRSTLEELGYQSARGAEHYQFSRAVAIGGVERKIKIDFLAPLPLDVARRELLKYDSRRARPRGATGFHAHVAPEASGIGEYATAMELSSGAVVRIVHPFNYIILKLHAFRDRLGDERKERGHYHAFDIYSIVAMMTEDQLIEAAALRDNYPDSDVLVEARRIAHEMFATAESPGTVAVRLHARQGGIRQDDIDVDGFLEDLRQLLPNVTH